jgi:hypothetical protein
MYAGGGVDPSACTDDVEFEDPVASCKGKAEVLEAFRALGVACSPHSLSPPTTQCANMDSGGRDTVLMDLSQEYFGFLRVRSTVAVQMANDGRICRFEERWNSATLLPSIPFGVSRRLNGLLSYAVTRRVL